MKTLVNVCTIISFIDILSAAGINCEVWLGTITRNGTNKTNLCASFIKMKDSDAPVDTSRLLSCSAPAIQRFYEFAAIDFAVVGAADHSGGEMPRGRDTRLVDDLYKFDATFNISDSVDQNISIITEKVKEILK